MASRFPSVSLAIAACAAAITFVPTPRGGIRIIQALLLIVSGDSVIIAALVHAAIAGALSYAIFRGLSRRGATVAPNIVPLTLFIAYVVVYFSVGLPMVALMNRTISAGAGAA
jgi:hypothetical protein